MEERSIKRPAMTSGVRAAPEKMRRKRDSDPPASSLSVLSGAYLCAYIINAVVIVQFCSALWLYVLNAFLSQC